MKIGVNEICPCGSGKKYKKCHKDRELQDPIDIQYLIKKERIHRSKKYCLHPEANPSICRGGIVKAHTIQRNGGLSRISHDGHVYGYLQSLSPSKDVFSIEKVGINKASTFTGFCNYHDTKTFEPIERHEFQNTQEQSFLFSYRALCKELYEKRGANAYMNDLRNIDAGRSIKEQIEIQSFINQYLTGNSTAIRDAEEDKREYDAALVQHNFSDIYYFVLYIDVVPEFLCNGMATPEYDFTGREVQDLSQLEIQMEHLGFSTIPTEKGGAIIFSWLGKQKKIESFIKSLNEYSNEEIPHAVVRFAITHFSNVYFSPLWWDSLDEKSKKGLRHYFESGVVDDRKSTYLKEDGLRTVSWNIVSRETNLIF